MTSLPVAPEATNVMGVPLTVMVSPGAKPVDSESVPAVPDSSVAPVIGAGGVAWLLTALPLAAADQLKKLLEAVIAEAATSEVLATVLIDDVRAVCRLLAVALGVAPMVNEPDGGGEVLVAVNCTVWVVPSGRLKVKLI